MPTSLIEVVDLTKWFPVKMGFFESLISKSQLYVKAVDGISFDIKKKEIFGLAGESGSGKTTTGRVILRLTEPTSGKIFFHEKDIARAPEEEIRKLRNKMQIIFQDPYESLNPRMTVFDIIAEPLRVQKLASGSELEEKVYKTLESIQLIPPEEFMWRFPHELSGGQRQRVATGRALTVNPEFIVADEPVSMLDVSIRAEILNLIFDLKERHDVAFLYITHDLALARHICDRIAVMYLGKIMEKGPAEKVIFEALHPYTQALISAVPDPNPEARRIETVIKGEIPSPLNPPKGCRFHTRCPQFIGNICKDKEPLLLEVEKEHYVACHLYDK
jgi:peptide/nickel transport system ATP-binding protein